MANENQPLQQETPGPQRILFTIPDFDEFADLLHDRLHGLLLHFEGITSQIMLITNLLDRDQARIEALRNQKAEDLERLVYAGTRRQRERLEQSNPVNYIKTAGKNWDQEKWRKERDIAWNALSNQQMTRMEGVETFGIFDAFREGISQFDDVKIGTLKDYFSGEMNILKINEKPIIADYFDLKKDLYIGFPLLGLGKFQGIAWVVFKAEERPRFENAETKKRILKLFELIYSDLVYGWEVSGKTSLINTAIEESEQHQENPIQKEIGLRKLYQDSKYYQDNRLRKNEAVLNEIKEYAKKNREQLLRTATISILLDSFAHNISAHSLTALSWWFRERSEYLGGNKTTLAALGRDLNPLVRHYKLGQENDLLHTLARFLQQWESGGQGEEKLLGELWNLLRNWDAEALDGKEQVHRQRPTLSRELYPLFNFLLEKGAFWSGITRLTNFAGKTSILYSVLWNDFLNNPLYLGTIANTEEVLKLHIRITIYEKEERVAEDDHFRNLKTIKKSKEGVLLDGILGVINLQDFKMAEEMGGSVFVEKGALYEALSEELKTIRVFFPGGVVGKHAFFTLLENEIRNVKHFQGDALRVIQQEGLTLNISLHERPFDSQNPHPHERPSLLKVGVWLNHPVNLTSATLVKRIENLDEDIIMPDSSRPRLGGNFQDKICASMLMTGTFGRVQDRGGRMGDIYYPWLKTAGYHIREDQGQKLEFEVSQRRYRETPPEAFKQAFASDEGDGYLKKYFHLWKSDDILSLDVSDEQANPADLENQGRFRFLHLKNADSEQYDKFKAEGIIRILTGPEPPASVAEAYRIWLKKWMKVKDGSQELGIDFKEGATIVARLTYQKEEVRFENKAQIESRYESNAARGIYSKIPQKLQMGIAHGSQLSKNPEKLNYRSDGELIRHFCQGKPLKEAEIQDQGELFELLEAFATKMCIFDHRVYNRMYSGDAVLRGPEASSEDLAKLVTQRKRLEVYRDHLRLDIHPEKPESWRETREQDFLNHHFLIVHLSFMESLKDAKGNSYSEERIIEFIDDQILQGRPAESVGDDFFLVITTGRGREQWWETIKAHPKYARFTTFRPIESILSTMEDAMQVADDFNLKYNMTKLLFGS